MELQHRILKNVICLLPPAQVAVVPQHFAGEPQKALAGMVKQSLFRVGVAFLDLLDKALKLGVGRYGFRGHRAAWSGVSVGGAQRYPLERQVDTARPTGFTGRSLEKGRVAIYGPFPMAFPYCLRQGRHNLPGPSLCPRLRRQTGDFLRHSLEIRTPTVETDPRSQGSLVVGVRIFFFFLVACLLGSVHAEDLSYGRLTMVDNGEETGMRDCIKQAAEAASQEDLDTYISCFTDSQKKPVRRRTAMLFVRHTM